MHAYRRLLLPFPLELLPLLPLDRELPEEPEWERPEDEPDDDGLCTLVEVELLLGLVLRLLPDVERVAPCVEDFPPEERFTRRDDPEVPVCVFPVPRLEVPVILGGLLEFPVFDCPFPSLRSVAGTDPASLPII